jgi:hypothetical protein
MGSARLYDEAFLMRAEANQLEEKECEIQSRNWVNSIARLRR